MNNKGFTLIELMIIIAIAGIFCAIAIPQFEAYKTKQREAQQQAYQNEKNKNIQSAETVTIDGQEFYAPSFK